ncbi:EAL domain-containing protein [Marinobacter salinisoli]|uniref:EAL domain-containing protein n=1 Tax=Marinobacter salinisoli TaxID=2769486 RepID=A0ABX7MTS0_9GAMM|nr:EAL domain-containing protein [Marinobacter salinisoli]QSP95558.1 EAL domain-containing protein [Marinobacter salinisoli]
MSNLARLGTHRHAFCQHGHSQRLIHSHQFKSVYQPILSPTHQKLVGYEALVRVSRDHQTVSPVALFERAAQLNQTPELDRHLLDLHLDNFSVHSHPAWLFLNINPGTCEHPEDALQRLAERCTLRGIQPEQVVLELIETASGDHQALMTFIHNAKMLGFNIAIDDFGVGDSNFERLWRINPMIVKLDRSLLVNAEHNCRARLLLESLIRMIRESGSLVLLEGVESDDQARIAIETEVDLLQGYCFARPSALSNLLAGQAEAELEVVIHRSRKVSLEDVQSRENYLRQLQLVIRKACRRLVQGESLPCVSDNLLALDGIQRCFLLDHRGVQQGSLARARDDVGYHQFNPLYQSAGACWKHREYFQNAQAFPERINCSRPYVALPDAKRTVTLSTAIDNPQGHRVMCVDIHPDELFAGQMTFPATL